MGKFGSFLNKTRKNLSENIKNYKSEKDSLKSVKKTMLMVKIALAIIPVVFFGAAVVIIIMAAMAPVILVTGIVGNVLESVGTFGSKVGNLFTSGCYGTDEECLARDEAEAEQTFFDATKTIYDLYYVNSGNKMSGELNDDKYNENQAGYARFSYGPIINIPVLVSTIMYEKLPEDGYYELLYGTTSLSITKNELKVLGENYLWYSDEEDPVGIDYDGILAASNVSDANPCGNYNEVYQKAIEGDQNYASLIEKYTPDTSWWGAIGKFFENTFTNNNSESKLRLIAKKLTSKVIESTCTEIKDPSTGKMSKSITTRVKYDYDEEKYKQFLIEDYLSDVLKENYYNQKFRRWLTDEGYTYKAGVLIKVNGDMVSSSEKKEIEKKSEEKIKELQNIEYIPTENEIKMAAEQIISTSEYYEYILEELMSNRGAVVNICTGVTVNLNDTLIEQPYELENLVAGFVKNLKNVYGSSTNDVLDEAAAIVFRSYILYETGFCKEPLDLYTIENEEHLKYVEPEQELKDKLLPSRGKVLYLNDDIMPSHRTKFEYIKHGSSESSTPESDIKLQDLQDIYNDITPATDRTSDNVLLKYFKNDTNILIKKVTGGLIGGTYSSSAPVREGKDPNEIRQAVDFNGKEIYNSQARNIGQCPWYSKYRAIEVLMFSDMDASIRAAAINAVQYHAGDGAGWGAYSKLSNFFPVSTNVNEAKPGSVVSWAGGIPAGGRNYQDASGIYRNGYGHVAIVEKVNYSSPGKVSSIIISDGWKKKPWSSYSGWSGVEVRYGREMTADSVLGHTSNGDRYYFAGYVFLLG